MSLKFPLWLLALSGVCLGMDPLPVKTNCSWTEMVDRSHQIHDCTMQRLNGTNSCQVIRVMLDCFEAKAGDCIEKGSPQYAYTLKHTVLTFMALTYRNEGEATAEFRDCPEAQEASTFLLRTVLDGSRCKLADALDRYLRFVTCVNQQEMEFLSGIMTSGSPATLREGLEQTCRAARAIERDCPTIRECMSSTLERKVATEGLVAWLEEGKEVSDVCGRIEETTDRLGQRFEEFDVLGFYGKYRVKAPGNSTAAGVNCSLFVWAALILHVFKRLM